MISVPVRSVQLGVIIFELGGFDTKVTDPSIRDIRNCRKGEEDIRLVIPKCLYDLIWF